MKRLLLSATLVFLPLTASALTVDDLTSQIATLMQQISVLQSHLDQGTATQPSATTPATSTAVPVTTAPTPAQTSLTLTTQTAAPQGYCPSFSRNLSRGANGTEVMFLQRYLLGQGLLTADALSGYFGPQTEKALQSWQAQYGIVSSGTPATTGWGMLGPKTMRLVSLNCKAQTQAQTPQATGPNSCPLAGRPNTICSGSWQAVSDQNGCTTAWRCVIPLPGSGQSLSTTTQTGECPFAPRPTSYCSGSWSAVTDASGCTVAWQCAVPLTQSTPTSCPSVLPQSGNCVGQWQAVYAGSCQTGWQCVNATPTAHIHVTIQPTSARRGSRPGSAGDAVQILWSSQNVPDDAAVSLWLIRADGTNAGLIAGGQPTDGNVTWQVPGPQCDTLGNCIYQTDSASVYYVDPGNYSVLARLYTPHDAYLSGMPPANPIQPNVVATSYSGNLSITAATAMSADSLNNVASALAALKASLFSILNR